MSTIRLPSSEMRANSGEEHMECPGGTPDSKGTEAESLSLRDFLTFRIHEW
jgi:hypothetical protein